MKLLFWRKDKEPKTDPIVLIVPSEEVFTVLTAWDRYIQRDTVGNKIEKYALWRCIEKLFPQVAESGMWRIKFVNSTTIHIVETIEDEK